MAQVSSKRNKEVSAEHTRATGRNKRINEEYNSGKDTVSGDFNNSSDMKKYRGKESGRTGLTQQNVGNHNQRYRDIVAAFGRASKKVGVGGKGLSFSGG